MTTEIIFDLSKEYPLLAHDEIISCLEAEQYRFETKEYSEDALVLSVDLSDEQIRHLGKRLSMSFSIGKLLFTSSPILSEISDKANNHPLHRPGSLAVRSKNRSKKHHSKRFLQAVADVYTHSRSVDLNYPDIVIFVLITDEFVHVSEQIITIPRGDFERRKAHLRPFFSPISLHPKIARSLVNISRVKPGDYVLDPFCGTGGFLIEAGLMNINVIGNDISKDMVLGAEKNLNAFQISPSQMFSTDITHVPHQLAHKVDAVVTDFPYGRATSTQGESTQQLYIRAITSIQQMLKPGGRAVVGTFSEQLNQHTFNGLTHIISYPLRVHKSLTRWFHVFEHRP